MFYGAMVLLIIVLSGDFFVSLTSRRRFGEITPCVILIYGFIVYVSGLFRCLNVGVAVSLILAVSLYLLAIILAIRNHRLKEGLKNFVNMPFFCFLFLFFVFVYGDYNQLTTGYDDPGHWMDCVKVMTYSGEFYANPETHSTFPTYPPMMAVIQLFVQKVYLFLIEGAFCEWLMFLTYHTVAFSLFMPLVVLLDKYIKENNYKEMYRGIFCTAFSILICITVTVFFRTVHSRVGIDPFLACEGAVVFLVILYREKIRDFYLYIYLLLPAVVLTKDMGLLFAAMGVAYLMIDMLKEKKIKPILVAILSVIVSKVSWNCVIKYYGAIDPKPNKVNWGKYIKVLVGKDVYSESYKNESITAFRTALVDRFMTVGNGEIYIKYIYVIITLCILSIILCGIFRKNRKILLASIMSYVCLVMFILGLGGVYVDKFVYTEAVSLASFERYTNTVLCMLLLESLCIFVIELGDCNCKWLPSIVVVLIIVSTFSPLENTGKYLKRGYPEEEYSQREKTDAFAKKMVEICESGSNVYFLSQSDYGKRYIYVKFMIRPYLSLQSVAGDDYNWCFVRKADPNNIYFKEMHLEEWKDVIFKSGKYDYFAIMKSNAYIKDEFASLFSSPEAIIDNAIYRVDARNEKLILISE